MSWNELCKQLFYNFGLTKCSGEEITHEENYLSNPDVTISGRIGCGGNFLSVGFKRGINRGNGQ
jgi:hypothetical protein